MDADTAGCWAELGLLNEWADRSNHGKKGPDCSVRGDEAFRRCGPLLG